MWKNLLDKGKCLVGFHQGEWKFLHDRDCTSVRVCTHCAVKSQKIDHTWSGWDYVTEQRCDQQRSCGRCQGTEPRVVHLWQDPVWRFPDRCDRVQICSRCNVEKDAPAKHTWAEWEYLSPEYCTQAQRCERCGSMSREQRIEHLWGEWQHSEVHGGAVRVCRRCGELTPLEQPQVATIIANIANTAQATTSAAPTNTLSPERAEKFKQLRSMLDQHSDMQNTMSKILHTIHENAETTLAETASPTVSSSRAASPQQPEQDTRLIGHWRFTDMMSGGGFSQTTDYHRVLQSDGTFSEWNHSCSSFGEQRSQPDSGRWRTVSKNLYLQYDGSGEVVLEYYLENSSLLFPRANHQRLWERVR